MYRIYIDDKQIYDVNIDELKITNAQVELIQNDIGTFEFTIYPTNPYINAIKKMQSIVKVYQDDFLLFKGLVCDDLIIFNNAKKVKCKQDYYFLTFSSIRPYYFEGTPKELFEKFINEHNSQVTDEHKFKIGDCTVIDPNDYIWRSDSTYMNTWESIQKKLIELLGGYLRIRHEQDGRYIDYLADFDTKNAQEIKFGENMLDVQRETSGLDIATVLIPLGAKIEKEETEEEPQSNDEELEKRIDISSVNNGKDYIENLEAIEKHGRIVKTQIWEDVNEPSILLSKGQKFLNDKEYPITAITITAFDMAHVKKDISNFRMHNYIKCESAFHGIDGYYLPMKMNINLFVVKNNKIDLNTTRRSLTDIQIDESNKFGNVVEEVSHIKNNINKPYVELTSNLSVFQVFDKNTNEFTPNFENKNLVITPIVTLSSNSIKLTDCDVEFKRVINGVEQGLVDGESVNENKLVISKNTIETTVKYVCYVTFERNGKTYKTNNSISIVLLVNGADGQDGEDGKDGQDGKDGVAGATGKDGKTTYFHVKYAPVQNPTASQMTETPSKYIGTYVDYTLEDSNDPLKYTWSQFKGDDGKDGNDGQQGIAGTNGADGKTSYLHIKYSNDGGATFTANSGKTAGDYIGQYVDFVKDDSNDVNKYTWAKIKGNKGDTGLTGQTGADGKTYYTWLKYADSPTSGMSDSPTGKKYIGLAYNKPTQTESTNYGDYQWSLIQGEKGDTGLTGGKGADGKTYYTWIKYATSSTGANMSDDPTGKTFIGIAYNKPTVTESNVATDYSWSLIKGDKGETGKGVKSITNYYLATSSSSGVTTSTSGWTTTIQNISLSKKYLWNYEVVTYTDNTTSPPTTPCIIGAYGDTGQTGNTGATGVGISSITEHYQVSTSNTTAPTSWLETVPTLTATNKYLWNYETIKYTDNTTKDTLKRVIGVYGDKGNTGAAGTNGTNGKDGTNGIGISKTEVFYYLSTSNTAQSGGSWSTTVPTWENGKYYWQKIKTTYTNNTTSESVPVCITGAKGQNGSNGTNGQDGKGIKSTVITYQASSSGTATPTGTWQSTIPSVSANQYLWTRTVITYTDNTTSTSYSIGKMGANGSNGTNGTNGKDGADGKGIKSTAITYQASTSGTTVPTGTWGTAIPSVSANQYLWTRTVITYTDNSTSTSYSIGKMGANGSTGATGKGVSSITAEFYLSTSKDTPTGGSWSTTMPTWSSGKYLWTRNKIVYTNPTSTDYTTPLCDSSWEAVNEIQIGGRNYILNSDFIVENMNNSQRFEISTDFLENARGKSICISCDYEVVNVTNNTQNRLGCEFQVTLDDGTKKVFGVWKSITTGETSKGRIQAVHKFDENVKEITNPLYAYVYFITGDKRLLKNFKLEIGTKMTDYTLAPEDIENDYNSKFDGINDNIIELTKDLTSSIDQTKDSIVSEVAEKYFTKDEAEILVEEHSTTLAQTKDMFEMKFTQFIQSLDELATETNNSFDNIVKYIRFIDGKIILGEVGNQLELQIQKDKIAFLQANNEVAFFSNSKLFITDVEVINSFRIGKFAYIPRENGSLSFKKVG